jgi:hypothetical protein
MKHCTTSRKVASSRPTKLLNFINLPISSGRNRLWDLTQYPTKMSTRDRKRRNVSGECSAAGE